MRSRKGWIPAFAGMGLPQACNLCPLPCYNVYIIMEHQRPTVALDFLGCKLNQAEIEELARQLSAAGYTVVPADSPADIYVLNTCTVTHVADRKSRQLLRQARRRNPDARLVAVGCYAEREPDLLQSLDGVELVLGNDLKNDLVKLLGPAVERGGQPFTQERTRSFVKVQEGCRNFCAYCIVPLVRNRVACVPAEDVIRTIRALETEGKRECVLTGTEIGTYRDGETGLGRLLERILAETGIERLRISSLQPPEISRELAGLWQDPRLCPHFHLSLQSGSDAVLRRMRRRYTIARYREAVELIRNTVQDAAITTDIIVGFPGETDEEFEESLAVCRDIGFARIHVFPYSPRPGTAAVAMDGQVAEEVKRERSRAMMELGRESARRFHAAFLGQEMDVLFEQASGGVWDGHTGNYIKVYVKSARDLCNEILPVRLVKLYRDGVFGER